VWAKQQGRLRLRKIWDLQKICWAQESSAYLLQIPYLSPGPTPSIAGSDLETPAPAAQ
jgi:hypothetical protein